MVFGQKDRTVGRDPAPAPMMLHDAAAPLALLSVVAAAVGVAALVWLASHAAAGPGWAVPALGFDTLRALLAEDALDRLIGPDGSRPVFFVVLFALGCPVLVGGIGAALWLAARYHRTGTAEASLASRGEYRDMRGKGAERRARSLRPGLNSGPINARDLGLRIGATAQGDHLYASEEDVALIIAGPRSNKTSALVVPGILTAPGPVIATSNKIDVWALTYHLRSKVGEAFVLDPQKVAGIAQSWWWNPLRDITDIAHAKRLMDHFLATVGGGSDRADPYFTAAASRLLNQLVLAAALSGHCLRDVRRWLTTRDDRPIDLLAAAGAHDAAAGLQGLLEAPEDQKGGVYETALTGLSCLESETVLRYITPPQTWVFRGDEDPIDLSTIREFDPWQFLVGYTITPDGDPIPRDTLYALTQEGAGSAAPVVAALVDRLLLVASSAATATGGRLSSVLRVVLDEAANICPIRNLPELYSYFGSMSIQVMTFLQSFEQGVALWGKSGMAKLETAATVYLIGAGAHDAEFCERISRLVGDHDVPTWSDQRARRGHSSVSRSYRRDRILAASEIAELPKTHAVLISSGRRSGLIKLLPWYTESEAGLISGHAADAVEQARQMAIIHLGEDNAFAQHLIRLQRGER